MRRRRWSLAAASLLAASAGAAPYAAIDDLQRLFIEDTVALITPPSPAAAAKARALMDAAATARARGANGEMRRSLAEARAALAGIEWTPAVAFAASLAPRPAHVVVDPSLPLALQIGQHFAATAPAGASIEIVLRGVTMRGAAPTFVPRPLARLDVATRDLIDRPALARLSLADVPDGAYDLITTVRTGASEAGAVASRIYVVRNWVADAQRLRAGLAGLTAREPLTASIAYPLDLAQGLDEGSRDVVAYDFRAGVDRALALLTAAQAGRDPLWQARGDQPRAYRSALTRRIEPYRIYVPQAWDGHASLPLVVMLHGSNGDEKSMFADGKAVALAEARGWALLAPFGYSPNGGWGNHLPVVLANGTMPAPRPSTRANLVLPRDGMDPEPAEADVLETIARVRAEYPIDATRIYLLGNSMGGEGTWHLAARHPDLWAAAAPGAGAIDPAHFPYARLRTLPMLVVHDDADPIISFAASKQMVGALQAEGAPAQLLAVPGGGHGALATVLPAIFDFFATQARVTPAPAGAR